MERLTDKNDVGSYFYPKCFEKCDGLGASRKCDNCEITTSICEKLGKYEDLEEQGRLIKIPLEAYCIVDFKVRKGFVLEETYHMSRKPLLVVRYDDNSLKSHRGHLGISVFLTKSEAEAKLKELRGGENESSN